VIGIRVQAGRVSMDATLMAGCIKRSGLYDYKVAEHTISNCVLHFFENRELAGVSTFSMEDAKKAGLSGKDTWRAYPRNMLFARALSNGARWYCAGIFGGSVYTHEELGYAVDEEGRAVTGNADLCTREQRQEILQLAGACNIWMSKLLEQLGVRMLDELSGYEAAKLIKKLAKQAAEATTDGRVTAATDAAGDATPGPVHDVPAPAGVSQSEGTPATQMIQNAFDENSRPSTLRQRAQIIDLAERMEPDEKACEIMIRAWLEKRNVARIAELTHLQASALIEAGEARLADCPFDAGPMGAMQRANPTSGETAKV